MNDLASTADENLATHASWVATRLPGASVRHDPDLVLVDSGLPCDTFNFACRARLEACTAPARVREAISFFSASGHPFSWWLGPGYTPAQLPSLLTDNGLAPAETELAMALDLDRLPETAPNAPELRIRRVRTAADLETFARLAAANWEPPDPWVLAFYRQASPLLLAPDAPQWLFVGTVSGAPVATAELAVGGGVVGLYNISTLPQHRRRGIGLAMTYAPLAEAKVAGWRTAVLQAAAAGVGIYRVLGFETFGDVTEFKPTEAGPGGSGR